MDTKAMDREANVFAMELLMPREGLLADVIRLGGIDLADDLAVEAMAKRYRVPVAFMAIRLWEVVG